MKKAAPALPSGRRGLCHKATKGNTAQVVGLDEHRAMFINTKFGQKLLQALLLKTTNTHPRHC